MLKQLKSYSRTIGILLVTVAIVLPSFLGIYNLASYFLSNRSESNEVVFNIDGKSIYEKDLSDLKKYEDKVLYLNSFIKDTILDNAVKKLHIRISSEEVNEEYNKKVEQARSKRGQDYERKRSCKICLWNNCCCS